MNKFRVASRWDKRYELEKCPVCKNAFQDFLELSEDLLGCFSCGVVFVPKHVKDSEYAGKKVQLEKQLAEVKEEDVEPGTPGALKCSICGKLCKSKLGLMSHQRKHGINA
jgi:hypothetical protein